MEYVSVLGQIFSNLSIYPEMVSLNRRVPLCIAQVIEGGVAKLGKNHA